MSQTAYTGNRAGTHDHGALGPDGTQWSNALATDLADPDLAAKKALFEGFLDALLIFTTHIAQVTAALVVAFALGAGLWNGVAVFVVIGLAVGLAFRRRRQYWRVQGAFTLALVATALIASVYT